MMTDAKPSTLAALIWSISFFDLVIGAPLIINIPQHGIRINISEQLEANATTVSELGSTILPSNTTQALVSEQLLVNSTIAELSTSTLLSNASDLASSISTVAIIGESSTLGGLVNETVASTSSASLNITGMSTVPIEIGSTGLVTGISELSTPISILNGSLETTTRLAENATDLAMESSTSVLVTGAIVENATSTLVTGIVLENATSSLAVSTESINATESTLFTTIGSILSTVLSTFAPSEMGNVTAESTISGVFTTESVLPIENATGLETTSSSLGDLNGTMAATSTLLVENTTSSLATDLALESSTSGLVTGIVVENATSSLATDLALESSTSGLVTGIVENATSSLSVATEVANGTTIGNLLSAELSTIGSSELVNATAESTISGLFTTESTLEMTASTGLGDLNGTMAATMTELFSSTIEVTGTESSTLGFTTTVNASVETTSTIPLDRSTGEIFSTSILFEASTEPSAVNISSGQQVNTSVFDCTDRGLGLYGNPKKECDTKFYICVDNTVLAYEQPCPARLYFDDEMKVCESWIHIPACSGKSRPPTPSTLAPRNETGSTAAPAVDCVNKTDGNYPDPIGTIKPGCSNRFYVCIGQRSFQYRCPFDLIYEAETDKCERQDRVFACTGKRLNDTSTIPPPPATLPPVAFDCSGRKDGYYTVNCSNTFYSCNGGQARELECPHGLVFDVESEACDIPANVFICTGTNRTTKLTTTTERMNISTTPSPMDCSDRLDGIYPDPEAKCSRHFYFCAHNESFVRECPANLFYDAETKKCDLWLNVFACSGMRPTSAPKTTRSTPPSFPTVDFDCTHLEDGNYANPKNKCSKFYYVCANMEAFQQDCPSDLHYDPDRNLCDSWMNVFVCSGKTARPSTPAANFTLGTTEKPDFDCSTKLDGMYQNPVNACSHIYYQCVSGFTYDFECPVDLYFDIKFGRCDNWENVFACSGITPTPSKPSTPTTKPVPIESPIDCTFLADGDYQDPKKNCSNTYYSCAAGFAFMRFCPRGTVFDIERDQCDRPSEVFACTGKHHSTTPTGPSTKSTPRPVYPFDCTKRYDGNYPAGDCKREFWSCVGGLTFPRQCLSGLVYDQEFDDCEFPFMVPKCGGRRIESTVKAASTSKKPVVFDCAFLADGNYLNPLAKDNCSSVFYMCANGMSSRLVCPKDLFYDHVADACDHRENVAACVGKTVEPSSSTSAPVTISAEANTALATGTVIEASSTVFATTISSGVPVNESTIATVVLNNQSTVSSDFEIDASKSTIVVAESTLIQSLPLETTTAFNTSIEFSTPEGLNGSTIELTTINATEIVTSTLAPNVSEVMTLGTETSASVSIVSTEIINGSLETSTPVSGVMTTTIGLINGSESTVSELSTNMFNGSSIAMESTTMVLNMTELSSTAVTLNGTELSTLAVFNATELSTLGNASATELSTIANLNGTELSTIANLNATELSTIANLNATELSTESVNASLEISTLVSGVMTTTVAFINGSSESTVSELNTNIFNGSTVVVESTTMAVNMTELSSTMFSVNGTELATELSTMALLNATELSTLASEMATQSGNATELITGQSTIEIAGNQSSIGTEVRTTESVLLNATGQSTMVSLAESSLAMNATTIASTSSALPVNATTIALISSSELPFNATSEFISTSMGNLTTEAVGTAVPPAPTTTP